MEIEVKNMQGDKSGSVQVAETILDCEFNEGLVHELVVAFRAKARAGTKAQKNRSAVSGGGKKPWRQKGTGSARAGTTRGPLWRTGGVTFAASPRDYTKKMNRKAYRKGLRCILSQLKREDRLIVVDAVSLSSPKTKDLLAQLNKHVGTDAYVITSELDANLLLASRNLVHITVSTVSQLDILSLIHRKHTVITKDALAKLEESLA